MASRIFVNLPVRDLKKSMDFFSKLGFSFNEQFTDDKAACMVISDQIFAMLLVHERFKDFTKKQISDAKKTTEVLIALDAASKAEVDDIVKKAVNAGGSIYADPQDYGWMYSHSFADPDGHQWEFVYIDEAAAPQG